MDEGDPEFAIAYYCLHKFHWPPSTYINLSESEKAFVIAAIAKRTEEEEKAAKQNS